MDEDSYLPHSIGVFFEKYVALIDAHFSRDLYPSSAQVESIALDSIGTVDSFNFNLQFEAAARGAYIQGMAN